MALGCRKTGGFNWPVAHCSREVALISHSFDHLNSIFWKLVLTTDALDTMRFDPDSDNLPKRSELPDIPGAPKGAAWFWGADDEVLVLVTTLSVVLTVPCS